MTHNQIRFLLYILWIFIALEKISSQDYIRLEPEKFQYRLTWIIDSVNRNKDYSSYSIFWSKQNASCFRIKMSAENSTLLITLTIEDYLTSIHFVGKVHGKMLNLKESHDLINPLCPNEKEIDFFYTDYLNIVVLLGHDFWSGPHVMILRSQSTNMTYKERMDLVKSKLNGIFDFKSLRKVEDRPLCKMRTTSFDNFIKIQYRKCQQYIQCKKSERLLYQVLITGLALGGALWIIIFGIYCIRKRQAKAIIAP